MLSLNDNPAVVDANGSTGLPPAQKEYDYDPAQYDPSIPPIPSLSKTIIKAIVALVATFIAFGFGYLFSGVLNDRKSVDRRIDTAISAEEIIKPKVERYIEYVSVFKEWSNAHRGTQLDYNEKFFKKYIEGYKDYNFLLDITNEMPADQNKIDNNINMLAQRADQNPLGNMRGYSGGTLLLSTLLDEHIAETKKDMDEIHTLIDAAEGENPNAALSAKNVYCVRFKSAEVAGFAEKASRTDAAKDALGIYLVKRAVLDDKEASQIWANLKKNLSSDEVESLTYVSPSLAPKKGKGKTATPPVDSSDTSLNLSRLMIYEIQPVGSQTSEYVLSNEILLLKRDQILGAGSNALMRYKNRMSRIFTVAAEVEKAAQPLLDQLNAQSCEEKI